MPTIRAGELDVYYELHGSGPALLNISGTGADLRRMPVAASPMNDHFEVLSFDQRGLGQTSKPETVYSMADYADDAARLLRAVGWQHVNVLGMSFGGMVALHLALRHPDLVDRLVLCCTSAGGDHASYPLHELIDRDPDDVFSTRMRLLDCRWDPDAAEPIPGLGAMYDFIAAEPFMPAAADEAAGLRRQLAARSGHDVVGDLVAIRAPTLVCGGRHDGLAPMANAEFLADHIPNTELREFDGGHIFMLQDPTAIGTIIEFLEGGP